MALAVVDARTRTPIQQDYLVYLPGWTLERYLQEAPENAFWEFVPGEVVVHPPVRAEHQLLVQWLVGLLQGFCFHCPGVCGPILTGPAGLQVAPDLIREPDIFVLAPDDTDKARGFPVRTRLLLVEVVSPFIRRPDLEGEPREYYAWAGVVPEYWTGAQEEDAVYLYGMEREGYRHQALTPGSAAQVEICPASGCRWTGSGTTPAFGAAGAGVVAGFGFPH